MKGRIHSIESMGLVDGPGVRAVVFMQGCRMRCLYCHNPDTWDMNGGTEMDSSELVRRLVRFKPYFGQDGGVTFSGGEPLMQPEFLAECLRECRQAGLHTCVDTSGQGIIPAESGETRSIYEEILDNTDLILLDIKHYDPEAYRKLTGADIRGADSFLELTEKRGIPLWIRHVAVPGITDGREHFEKLKEYVAKIPNAERVQLLPYHRAGENKYAELGIEYPLAGVPAMNGKELKQIEHELFGEGGTVI